MQYARVSCGTRQLRVLACANEIERLRGLLGRPEPEPGVALLIDPCWAVHTLGMNYSIDVVFCDARWRVLRIVTALPPRRLAWARGAVRVLEFGANTARPLGLAVGVRLQPDDRLEPPATRTAPAHAAPALGSAPLSALAGLAAVTVLAALLLGGCASTPTDPGSVARRAPPLATRPTAPPEAARADLRLQADIDYASRAWPLAEAGYRELLRQDPRVAEYWERLGVVFLRTGRPREAVEALGAATRLRTPDAKTLQNLALAHLRAAADALRQASALPNAPGTLHASEHAVEALLPADLREPNVELVR